MCGKLLDSSSKEWIELSGPSMPVKLDFCSLECQNLYCEIDAVCRATENREVDDEDTNPGLGPSLKN